MPSRVGCSVMSVSQSRFGRVGDEAPAHEVVVHGRRRAAPPPPADVDAVQPCGPHQSCDALPAAAHAAAESQLRVHAWHAVRPARGGVDLADLRAEGLVGDRPQRRRATAPLVVARRRHPQHPAGHRDEDASAASSWTSRKVILGGRSRARRRPPPASGSRSPSPARGWPAAGARAPHAPRSSAPRAGLRRCPPACSQLRSVWSETPRSVASCVIGFSRSRANSTARWRNSAGYRVAILDSFLGDLVATV